jgi:predicted lipoprotein
MQHPFYFLLAGFLLLPSCITPDSNDSGNAFDRKAMLTRYAEQFIEPAFAELRRSTSELHAKVGSYADAPSPAALSAARKAWAEAMLSWQQANAFNFGPAGESGLRKTLLEEIATFPASESKIEQAIARGDHRFDNFDRDARGLLAVEYLLFGKDQNDDTMIQTLSASPSRKMHLKALSGHLKERAEEVAAAWTAYRESFIANAGTDAGSSTSLLYNAFVQSYEHLKNFKVGLPAGKRPGQTKAEPQLVEGYYSGLSLPLLKGHFNALENVYLGRSATGVAGTGFRAYLETVEGGTELVALTLVQLQAVRKALEAVPSEVPFSQLIASTHPSVETLHTELQKLTRFFKSDMSSLLGISITYNSGDGD